MHRYRNTILAAAALVWLVAYRDRATADEPFSTNWIKLDETAVAPQPPLVSDSATIRGDAPPSSTLTATIGHG